MILDEPTNDVDPLRRRMLWQQVRGPADRGVAVLLVTHNVLEAEKAVDRLAVIDYGRLIAEGTPSSMKAADRGHLRLQLMIAPGRDAPGPPPFARRCTLAGRTLMAVIDEAGCARRDPLGAAAIGAGAAEEYALSATSLEDAYIELTGHGPRQRGGRRLTMPRRWLHGYWRMLAWDLAGLRLHVPVLELRPHPAGGRVRLRDRAALQPHPQAAAIFVSTGVAGDEPHHRRAHLRAATRRRPAAPRRLRVPSVAAAPRSATALAWYTVTLVTALPAVSLTLLAGLARYHLHLAITPMIIPAFLLTCLTGVLMG